ncbi:hypothetical protein KIW84_031641 [Lathyrus oleraceus]|uniref:Retrotransposon gag domain-containing protein n=1 Tax=Pisum sativum TaxID=3888 RepID=A0A9D4XVF1_PEA|nr:hypothetical protein KIW84_031641 [Pisum sativum]
MSPRRTSTDRQNTQPIADMVDAIQAIHAMATAIAQQSATTIQQAETSTQQAVIRAQREALRDQGAEATAVVRELPDFNRQNPPKFKGEHDPDNADLLIQEIKIFFEMLHCTDAKKVEYATFLLRAEAESWWRGAKQLMESNNAALDWATFKNKFVDKYFPSTKYFLYFHDHVDENYKCERFEQGLRCEIKESVEPLEIRQFQVLVEKCKKVEQIKQGRPNKWVAGGPSRHQRSGHFARDYRALRRDHIPSTNNNNDDIRLTAKGSAYHIGGEEALNAS